MIIEQVQVGNFAVFAYVVGCPETGEGIVIDPADQVEVLLDVAKNRQINRIKYIVNTHCHADHAGGNREMKERTDAQIVVHKDDAERLANPSALAIQIFQCEASPPADITVEEADYTNGYVFTGDTLFIGGIGRTDLPGGSMAQLIQSIKNKLLALPDDTLVFPGHNYGLSPQSTIGKEKQYNPFVR
jgi:glyoxylase-like metal-dependent hydrolase (beta-lactamase superfamily II)